MATKPSYPTKLLEINASTATTRLVARLPGKTPVTIPSSDRALNEN